MSNSVRPQRQPTAGLGVILLWGWAPTVQYFLPSSRRVYTVCTVQSQRIFCKSFGYFLYTTQSVHNQRPHTCHPGCQNVTLQNTLTGNYWMKEQDLYLPCRKCFKTDKEEWTSWWSTPRKKAHAVSMSILQEDHFEAVACQLHYFSESPRGYHSTDHWATGSFWFSGFGVALRVCLSAHPYLRHFETFIHIWNILRMFAIKTPEIVERKEMADFLLFIFISSMRGFYTYCFL